MTSPRAKTTRRRFRRPAWGLFATGVAVVLGAPPAWAHAFGTRYDLPLPLNLYLAGAGGAVALSFVIMALAVRSRTAKTRELEVDILGFGPARALLHPAVSAAVGTISIGLFILILAAGFFGTQDTIRNLAPALVWIVWWVGLAYVAALAGNIWPAINPWSIVYAGFERLVRLCGARRRGDLGLAYPSWLGVWPAVLLFGLFAWFELISEEAQVPATLAAAILIYSGFTWSGMALFGRHVWLAHGEAFALAFGVFGRFAPLGRPEREGPDGTPRRWLLRAYAGDLVTARPCHLSMTIFVLTMLATVTFDGSKETPLWGDLLQWMAVAPPFHAFIRNIHDLGFDFQVVLETVVLALFPLLFLVVYLGVCWLSKRVAGGTASVTDIAGLFVFSLVPIAIAYHLAHYLSYLLIAGQLVIPLASDPFGVGWNLFGTADHGINIAVIGPEFVWYVAVIAIVVGHVIAVGVAHLVALRVYESAATAVRSQVPFLVLMVAYTMMSLWIFSQPIVGGPSLGNLRASSGTLSLAPFEFREICLDLEPGERVRYHFLSERPVEFNIHYHDGLAIRYPVKLTTAAIPSSTFVAETAQSYCLMWFNRNLQKTSLTYEGKGP